MNKFSPFQAPVYSFFSKDFYKDLLLNGKGMGFVYLFLLLAVTWSLQTGKIVFDMQTFLQKPEYISFMDQLPSMKWQEGKLSSDRPSPFTIKDTDGKPLFYFDLSGKTTSLADAGGAKVLVKEDCMIAQKNSGVEEMIPWDKFPDFAFDKDQAKSGIAKLVPIIGGVIWGVGIFVWLGHLIAALIYGVFGLIMDKQKLGYPSMVRLASFAMTPSILLSMVQVLIGFAIPAFVLVSIIMTLGFMYFGNQSVKDGAAGSV